MPSRELTFHNEVGLHARPAALFAKRAADFDADISLEKEGRQANARSLLSVLTLDIRQGDSVVVRAEGDDADAALDALAELTARM